MKISSPDALVLSERIDVTWSARALSLVSVVAINRRHLDLVAIQRRDVLWRLIANRWQLIQTAASPYCCRRKLRASFNAEALVAL